jgi:hypothetical protein
MRNPGSAISLVWRTLQWIAYAEPKLDLEEPTEIVSLDDDESELDPEACPDTKDLLRLCKSLVRRGRDSLELAHFMVLEFLEAIEPSDQRLNKFRLNKTERLTLAKICV